MIDLPKIIATKKPKVAKTLFIAVDGRGGSGKSTLAELLGTKLHAEIIHTDDFSSWDNPLDWYPLLIANVFEPISDGAEILSYQPSAWWENHHPDPVTDQSVTHIMILEGVSATRHEFQDYISLSIFVDTPKAVCIERGIARDTKSGVNTDELRAVWEKWAAAEDFYIKRDQPKENADIVIDGTLPFADQIAFN